MCSTTIRPWLCIIIKNDYSQLPVIDNGIVWGSITDRILISLDVSMLHAKLGDVMGRRFPVLDPGAKIKTIRHLLEEYQAVLVDRGGKQYGIITKHDLLKNIPR